MNPKARLYLLPRTVVKIWMTRGLKPALRFISDYHILRKAISQKLAGAIERNRVDDPGVAYQKYLDTDLWVYENLRRVYFLGLNNRGNKKTILDLGTGAGYFPFICNYFGHTAEALDIPDNNMYNEIIRELGIRRYTQYIEAYKDLDTNGRYDLITGFMICFNNHKRPGLWHIDEWKYFLESVSRKNLNPGGNLFLSFNEESREEPVNRELLDYFINRMASIKDREVFLSREAFLKPQAV